MSCVVHWIDQHIVQPVEHAVESVVHDIANTAKALVHDVEHVAEDAFHFVADIGNIVADVITDNTKKLDSDCKKLKNDAKNFVEDLVNIQKDLADLTLEIAALTVDCGIPELGVMLGDMVHSIQEDIDHLANDINKVVDDVAEGKFKDLGHDLVDFSKNLCLCALDVVTLVATIDPETIEIGVALKALESGLGDTLKGALSQTVDALGSMANKALDTAKATLPACEQLAETLPALAKQDLLGAVSNTYQSVQIIQQIATNPKAFLELLSNPSELLLNMFMQGATGLFIAGEFLGLAHLADKTGKHFGKDLGLTRTLKDTATGMTGIPLSKGDKSVGGNIFGPKIGENGEEIKLTWSQKAKASGKAVVDFTSVATIGMTPADARAMFKSQKNDEGEKLTWSQKAKAGGKAVVDFTSVATLGMTPADARAMFKSQKNDEGEKLTWSQKAKAGGKAVVDFTSVATLGMTPADARAMFKSQKNDEGEKLTWSQKAKAGGKAVVDFTSVATIGMTPADARAMFKSPKNDEEVKPSPGVEVFGSTARTTEKVADFKQGAPHETNTVDAAAKTKGAEEVGKAEDVGVDDVTSSIDTTTAAIDALTSGKVGKDGKIEQPGIDQFLEGLTGKEAIYDKDGKLTSYSKDSFIGSLDHLSSDIDKYIEKPTLENKAKILDKIHNKDNGILSKLSSQEKELEDLNKKISSCEGNIKDSEESIKNIKKNDVYKTDSSEIASDIITLENDIKYIRKDIDNIKNDINNITKDIKNIKSTINNISENIDDIEKLKTLNIDLKKETTKLKEHTEDLHRHNEELKEHNKKLKKDNEKTKGDSWNWIWADELYKWQSEKSGKQHKKFGSVVITAQSNAQFIK